MSINVEYIGTPVEIEVQKKRADLIHLLKSSDLKHLGEVLENKGFHKITDIDPVLMRHTCAMYHTAPRIAIQLKEIDKKGTLDVTSGHNGMSHYTSYIVEPGTRLDLTDKSPQREELLKDSGYTNENDPRIAALEQDITDGKAVFLELYDTTEARVITDDDLLELDVATLPSTIIARYGEDKKTYDGKMEVINVTKDGKTKIRLVGRL